MKKDITPVKDKKQEEFTHVKLIRDTMKALGLIPAELSRRSLVDPVSIHRMLEEGKDVYGSKVYALLEALHLICKDEQPRITADAEDWKNKYISLLEKMDRLRDELDLYKEKGSNVRYSKRTGQEYRTKTEGRIIYVEF